MIRQGKIKNIYSVNLSSNNLSSSQSMCLMDALCAQYGDRVEDIESIIGELEMSYYIENRKEDENTLANDSETPATDFAINILH